MPDRKEQKKVLEQLERELDRLVAGDAGQSKGVAGPLIEAAAPLTRLKAAEPSDGGREAWKQRFLTHARELGPVSAEISARQAPRHGRRVFARRLAAAAAAFVFSSSPVVYAASGTMPDSPLYGVKRASESAALTVTFGGLERRLENVFAERRLNEADYLLSGSSANRGQALELLAEARDAGDRGLKNRVDELLEKVAHPGGRKTEKRPRQPAETHRGPAGAGKSSKADRAEPKAKRSPGRVINPAPENGGTNRDGVDASEAPAGGRSGLGVQSPHGRR